MTIHPNLHDKFALFFLKIFLVFLQKWKDSGTWAVHFHRQFPLFGTSAQRETSQMTHPHTF